LLNACALQVGRAGKLEANHLVGGVAVHVDQRVLAGVAAQVACVTIFARQFKAEQAAGKPDCRCAVTGSKPYVAKVLQMDHQLTSFSFGPCPALSSM
jgi:hypothetical protein